MIQLYIIINASVYSVVYTWYWCRGLTTLGHILVASSVIKHGHSGSHWSPVDWWSSGAGMTFFSVPGLSWAQGRKTPRPAGFDLEYPPFLGHFHFHMSCALHAHKGNNKAWYSKHLKTRCWNSMSVFNSKMFFSRLFFRVSCLSSRMTDGKISCHQEKWRDEATSMENQAEE